MKNITSFQQGEDVVKARLIFLCAPLIFWSGYAGLGMQFLRNPSLDWIAKAGTIVFVGALYFVRVRTRGSGAWEKQIYSFIFWMLFIGLLGVFTYFTFSTTLPALYTQINGRPAQHEFVFERRLPVKPGRCKNFLRLARMTKGLQDSFCIDEATAKNLKDGQRILLSGTRSVWGFRFSLRPAQEAPL